MFAHDFVDASTIRGGSLPRSSQSFQAPTCAAVADDGRRSRRYSVRVRRAVTAHLRIQFPRRDDFRRPRLLFPSLRLRDRPSTFVSSDRRLGRERGGEKICVFRGLFFDRRGRRGRPPTVVVIAPRSIIGFGFARFAFVVPPLPTAPSTPLARARLRAPLIALELSLRLLGVRERETGEHGAVAVCRSRRGRASSKYYESLTSVFEVSRRKRVRSTLFDAQPILTLQIATYFLPAEERLQQSFKDSRVHPSGVRRQRIHP